MNDKSSDVIFLKYLGILNNNFHKNVSAEKYQKKFFWYVVFTFAIVLICLPTEPVSLPL